MTESQPPMIRIAIADDHPIIRDALRTRLSLEADFRIVAETPESPEVVDELRRTDADILLLNWNDSHSSMGMLELLRSRQLNTRVIILSAADDREMHIQAMKLGASGIVPSKSSPELLVKSIRKVHCGEIWLDARTMAALMQQFAAQGAARGKEKRHAVRLSEREYEIVELVAQGLKNKEIADQLMMSEQTVKNRLHSVFRKLGINDRLELALFYLHQNKSRSSHAAD